MVFFLLKRFSGLLAVLLLLQACSKKDSGESLLVTEKTPVMTFVDVGSQFDQDAKVKVKIQAPLQHKYENRDESYPDGVHVEFFDSLGVMTTTMDADSGYHKMASNSYRARGNVVVVNHVAGQKLETEVLNWDMGTREIYTDTLTPVKITTPTEIINGNGLRATQDFSEYEITGGVTGIFTIQDKQSGSAGKPAEVQ